jgi:hypothetical protein
MYLITALITEVLTLDFNKKWLTTGQSIPSNGSAIGTKSIAEP